jgi:molecular chaperone DnaK
MVDDAKRHADDDRRRKDEVEQRNEADTLAYQAEKMLRDLGDKVPTESRSDVEEKVSAVRKALEGQDLAEIKRRKDALSQAMQKVGEAAYQQADPGEAPEGQAQGGGDDEGTVEGEFREV